jgi:hypothetical protein
VTAPRAFLRGDLRDGGGLAGARRADEQLDRSVGFFTGGEGGELGGDRAFERGERAVAALQARHALGDALGEVAVQAGGAEPGDQRFDGAVLLDRPGGGVHALFVAALHALGEPVAGDLVGGAAAARRRGQPAGEAASEAAAGLAAVA